MKKLLLALVLTALSAHAFADKTVAELNPEFESGIVSSLGDNSFSLFHISDVHGDGVEFARLCAFYETYEKYFDGAVCTGDIVEESCVSDFDYWGKTPGHKKMMIAVGNHDALRDHKGWTTGPSIWDNQISMEETYNRYFAPFIKGWGVVYEEGKTYYYKDYPKSKVRLIVLDCMLRRAQDEEAVEGQLRWFKECLTGARLKNYTVAVAYHFPMWESVCLEDSNFNWRGGLSNAWYSELALFQREVDRFKKKGGDFALRFGGHTHCDYTNINPEYPNQICVCVCAATRFKCVVMTREEGAKSQDIANALIIDPDSHTFKVIRVGCDIDTKGAVRRVMTVDYKTGKVLAKE